MAIIKGNDVLFRYWDAADQEMKLFACARSITINMTAETIGKSTVGSGNWKEKEVSAMSWDFTEEGIQFLDVDDQMDVRDIIDLFLAGTPVVVSLYVIDENGDNEYYLNGNAIITQISANGAVNNMASLNITGEGTGPLVKDGATIYGNYPANFQITDIDIGVPDPGETTLTLTWDNAVPSPEAYHIKIRNVLTGDVTLQSEPGLTATVIVNDSSPAWELSIDSVYIPSVLESEYSPVIEYP